MSGSLYGMQGLGSNGMGMNAGGMVPPASPMSALLRGGGMGPMAQYMQPGAAGMAQPHPMLAQGPQQPFVPGQPAPGAASGQSPMAALLGQLQGGQQGLSQPGAGGANGQSGTFGPVPPGGLSGVLGNLFQGYNPQGYGMASGAPSPQLQQLLQGQLGGGGVA